LPLAAGAGFWFARNKQAHPPVVLAAPPVPVQAPPPPPAAAPVPEETPKPSAEATDSGSTVQPVPAVSAPAQPRTGARRTTPKKKDASAGEDLDVRNPYR